MENGFIYCVQLGFEVWEHEATLPGHFTDQRRSESCGKKTIRYVTELANHPNSLAS